MQWYKRTIKLQPFLEAFCSYEGQGPASPWEGGEGGIHALAWIEVDIALILHLGKFHLTCRVPGKGILASEL